MIQALIDHLQQYIPFDEEEKQYLREKIPVREVNKGAFLLKENAVSKEFFFNISGCVRMFYTVSGSERSTFFYTENQFISSYHSFTKQLPSKHALQCVEDTTLAVITHERAYEMLQLYPKFEVLARIMMEEELILFQEIISTFITMSPEERYLNLMTSHPELIQRIPQYHLATYIGVSPESLSRIKKRMVGK